VAKTSLVFGVITCVTGTVGTLMGSVLSKMYIGKRPDADGLICGYGLLVVVVPGPSIAS
jgi:putative Mn2+ efflux pump MntP